MEKERSKLDPKYIRPTVKHGGGSVMFWACFSRKRVGKIVVNNGKMDSIDYVDILANNLKESAKMMNFKHFKFQQDNDPKHTSQHTRDYFIAAGIEVLDWPPYSPDLNPIEHFWAQVKQELSTIKISNKKELFENVIRIWKIYQLITVKSLWIV